MDSRTITVIGVVIFAAVMSYGVHLAYGEPFEYSGSFPVPDNLEKDEKRCFIEYTDSLTLIYTCKYIFTAEEMDDFYEELIDDFGLEDPEVTDEPDETDSVIVIDSDGDGVIDTELIDEVKTDIEIEYEKALEKCENNPSTSLEDKDFCALLENLSKCYRGTDEAKGITSGSYIVSFTKIVESIFAPENIVRGDLHSQLAKAVQECIWQRTVLEPVLFGPEAFNKGEFFGINQQYHADYPKYDKEYWATIPVHGSDSAATERDFIVEAKIAWENMCESDKVSQDFKKDQGCTPPEYPTGAPRSDGYLPVTAYPLEAVKQFKLDRGESQLEKILTQREFEQAADKKLIEELDR